MLFKTILFVFGLIIGSFLNVLSLRYKEGGFIFGKKIIGGRSHCPHCGKNLGWYELIPVISFIIQKAKCRNCKEKISWQYPVVEILSGLMFVFVPLRLLNITNYQSLILNHYFSNYQLLIIICWLFIFLSLLFLSLIDFRLKIIPDEINLFLGVLGIIMVFSTFFYGSFDNISSPFLKNYAAIFEFRNNIFVNYSFAAFIGAFFFGLVIFLSRGRGMGMGDMKLIFALGLIFGWPEILVIILLSFIIGSVFGIVLLIKRSKKMKDAIPFGPFIVTASVIVFFFGYNIIDGYFKLFGIY